MSILKEMYGQSGVRVKKTKEGLLEIRTKVNGNSRGVAESIAKLKKDYLVVFWPVL